MQTGSHLRRQGAQETCKATVTFSIKCSFSYTRRPACQRTPSLRSLVRIPEPLEPLDDLPAGGGALVGALELPLERERDDDDERVGDEAGVHAGLVARGRVLVAEDGGADDAADAAGADEGGAAEGALPL